MLILFILLVLVFLILNILDAISTYKVVKRTSYMSEKNPIARFVIKKVGTIKGIMIIKSMIIVIMPMIIYAYIISKKEIIYVLIFMNILYFLVVFNNFRITRRIDRS